jgi:predicted ester cyclase
LSVEANKALVHRYFEEVIDGGNRAAMAELFVTGAPQHFPGRDITYRPSGAAPSGQQSVRTMRTELHHMLAEGDLVVAHLTHYVSWGEGTQFDTRVAKVAVGGKSVQWDAMALFRIENGKIAEEWVNRDELHILSQAGLVEVQGI